MASAADVWASLAADGPLTKAAVQRRKREIARQLSLPRIPTDAELLAMAPAEQRAEWSDTLRLKPTRTLSGVAVVSAMTVPHPCPHGVCTYCPGGPSWGTPQSYLGTEPPAQRAQREAYDPARQVAVRLAQLRAMGHPTDKVDLIVLGGTFANLPESYRESFIQGCFDGLNGSPSTSLAEAHERNESAAARCIGLTIETRPHPFTPADVDHCLALGTTRIEFGVQNVYDDVLEKANRAHTVQHVIEATALTKERGLKVGYHMMPGLPASDGRRDLEAFRRIFEDPAFRPDLLKIYPTLVVKGTALYEMWRRGDYETLTTDDAADLLARAMALVPPWVRVQRVQREIGAPDIVAGPRRGDLRNLVHARMHELGLRCRCIRCREVGRVSSPPENVELVRRDYDASGGQETFLAFEDPERDILFGYVRLRLDDAATVRELKVFGQTVPLGEHREGRWQHRGLGRQLMAEAEVIAAAAGHTRLRVTSGVGVRPYYANLGYAREGPYMAKALG